MSAPKGTCLECGRPIQPIQAAVYQVVGYEQERSQGGQNHVMRKRRLDGRAWHEHCWPTFMRKVDGTGVQTELVTAASFRGDYET